MRIVVAPDKFKGTLDAPAVADAAAAGIRKETDAEVVVVPLADGGEGTIDALLRAGATPVAAAARDPLGRTIAARLAILDDGRAVLESAEVGLGRLAPGERDALRASSAGVGDLIRAAQEGGATAVLVGVGGSAWTDGGTGMANALGWRFLDAAGEPLPPGGAALRGLDAIQPGATLGPFVTGLCDVDHVLLGARGAARTFAPQKGASPEEVQMLEDALARLTELRPAAARMPGAGAGGGLGYGIVGFLGGSLVPGFDLIADLVGLASALAGADLVVTGEGRLDESSFGGKTPVGVARLARRTGVACAAIAGRVTASPASLRRAGFADWISLADFAGDAARTDPAAAVEAAARALARRWVDGGAGVEGGHNGDTGGT